MARGWESKSVEDQISAREAQTESTGKPKRTPEQAEIHSRRESLMLARVRTLTSLQTACDKRYRAVLEQALAHLDAQLAELPPED